MINATGWTDAVKTQRAVHIDPDALGQRLAGELSPDQAAVIAGFVYKLAELGPLAGRVQLAYIRDELNKLQWEARALISEMLADLSELDDRRDGEE